MDWTAIHAQATANMTEAGLQYEDGNADIDGGQRDIDTLAWRRLGILPRAFHNVGDIDTAVTIGGRTISTPIFGAPTAYHRLASKNGEITSQNGMDRAGTFIVYPTNASEPVEHFAAEAQGDWWQQVYLFDNRKVSEAFIERSVASGAKALMLTLDCPGYRRDFGFRNGIDGTWEGASGNFPNMHMTDWTLNLPTSITPKDIQWLKEISGLPVYVKGVMRPEDAVTAMNAGAAGVMVSNHGRRQVDGVVPVAYALPRIRRALGRDAEIFADTGIRTGGDVFRALALGANAVGLGRPIQWAAAAGGKDGITKMIERITDELAHTMNSAGVSRIADIDESFLVEGQGPSAFLSGVPGIVA